MIEIKSEDDITGPVAAQLRAQLGVTQEDFWRPILTEKGLASQCENEWRGRKLTTKQQRLIYLRWVVGIPIDSTAENIRLSWDLASLSAEDFKKIRDAADKAMKARQNVVDLVKALEKKHGK